MSTQLELPFNNIDKDYPGPQLDPHINYYHHIEKEVYQKQLIEKLEFQLKAGQVPKQCEPIHQQFIIKVKQILCIQD